MKIIRHAEIIEGETYRLGFDYEGHPGWGFSFICNASGEVQLGNEDARSNYAGCLAGAVNGNKVVARGVQVYHHSYRQPAIGECHCGAHVELDGFTCECTRCGRLYNSGGQELSDPHTWGEETGEHWTECF